MSFPRLSLLIFSLSLLAACSKSVPPLPATCGAVSDCDSGEICDETGHCVPVCESQQDCSQGETCDLATGKCTVDGGGNPPVVDSVTGNNTSDAMHIVDGLLVEGSALLEASFRLEAGGDITPLAIRSQTDSQVELLLPEDIRSGEKVLVVTNSAGSTQVTVTLTLPELTGDILLERINTDATGTVAFERLPVGTSSTSVASGDHNHDTLTAAAMDSVVTTVSDAIGDTIADSVVDSVLTSVPKTHYAAAVVGPGESLDINIGKDASAVSVLAWRQEGFAWESVATVEVAPLLNDPYLHAYYDFEETTGTLLNDISGNGKDLTLSHNYNLDVPGQRGSGMFFGGTSLTTGGRAESTTFDLVLGDQLTMSVWVFPHIINADVHWMTLNPDGTNHDIYFSFYPPNCGPTRLSLRGISSKDQCTESSIPERQWTHLAATYNQATQTVEIYVNGRLDVRHTGQSMVFGGSTQNLFVLGERFSGHNFDFIGRMDEVAIFSRALSASEIYQLYARGMGFGGYRVDKGVDGTVSLVNANSEAQVLRMLVIE